MPSIRYLATQDYRQVIEQTELFTLIGYDLSVLATAELSVRDEVAMRTGSRYDIAAWMLPIHLWYPAAFTTGAVVELIATPYNPATEYAAADEVSFQWAKYKALDAIPAGSSPEASPELWEPAGRSEGTTLFIAKEDTAATDIPGTSDKWEPWTARNEFFVRACCAMVVNVLFDRVGGSDHREKAAARAIASLNRVGAGQNELNLPLLATPPASTAPASYRTAYPRQDWGY